MNEKVLDKGSVELWGVLGSDLTVVNAARVSYNRKHTRIEEKDKKLICYLAENRHMSPFRHVQFQFKIKAPEFVARQWYKHVVGAQYAFKDTAWNEISQRYVEVADEHYEPEAYRGQSADNKQASDGRVDHQVMCNWVYDASIKHAYDTYHFLLAEGVAREQARCVLPLACYTEWVWTASLEAVMNFISLRDHDHAQHEIREYAKVLAKMVCESCPISYNALREFL